jgi:hypothetical protein
LIRGDNFRGPKRTSDSLHLGALAAYVVTRSANVAVVGATDLGAIFFDNVSTAALKDGVGRDDFDLVFVAFSKRSH